MVVLTEADGSDGLGFGMPEKAEVLLHPGPVPPAVNDVVKIGCFDLTDEPGSVGEMVFRRGVDEAEAIAEREIEAPDTGEEINPG